MENYILGLSSSGKEMVNTAILNAKFHGIDLHHGVPNLSNGDCAIEAIADNISTRPEFFEVYNGGSEYNRRKWMEEAEELVFSYSGGSGMSEKAFREQWNILKQSGNYEYESRGIVRVLCCFSSSFHLAVCIVCQSVCVCQLV